MIFFKESWSFININEPSFIAFHALSKLYKEVEIY